MAQRIKNQEIIRRTDVPQRQSGAPSLTVQADLDSSRGYNALSAAATDTLGRLSSAMTEQGIAKKKKQDADDEARGSADRTAEDLRGEGSSNDGDLKLRGYTDAAIRGYRKVDGLLKVRNWQERAIEEMAKAEPGTNVDDVMNASLAEVMDSPEFADPRVRAELTPAFQRAAENVRATWQKQELTATFARQHESLTALAREEIKAGRLNTPEAIGAFAKNLDSEEFAFLNADDVDEIVAGAAIEELQTGDIDPAALVAEFEKPRADGKPGLMSSKWGEKIAAAAHAGTVERERRANEERNKALAEIDATVRDAADRGQATRGFITEHLARAGITAESDPVQFMGQLRYYEGQNQQTLDKWESERKAAARHAETVAALRNTNPYQVGVEKARKALNAEFLAAKTPEERKVALQNAARLGIDIPAVKTMFDTMTTSNFGTAAQQFENLYKIDPLWAMRHVSEKDAGMFYQYMQARNTLNMTHEDAMRSVAPGTLKVQIADVKAPLTKALRSAIYEDDGKTMKPLSNGAARPQAFTNMQYRMAQQSMIANPQVSPENALAAAEAQLLNRYTVVRGQLVPKGGAMKGVEPYVERVIEDVSAKLKAVGIGDENTQWSAVPLPQDTTKWVVTRAGFPAVDPDTKQYVVFDPNMTAAAMTDYDNAKAEHDARDKQRVREYRPHEHQPGKANRSDAAQPTTGAPLKNVTPQGYSKLPQSDLLRDINNASTSDEKPGVPKAYQDFDTFVQGWKPKGS